MNLWGRKKWISCSKPLSSWRKHRYTSNCIYTTNSKVERLLVYFYHRKRRSGKAVAKHSLSGSRCVCTVTRRRLCRSSVVQRGLCFNISTRHISRSIARLSESDRRREEKTHIHALSACSIYICRLMQNLHLFLLLNPHRCPAVVNIANYCPYKLHDEELHSHPTITE